MVEVILDLTGPTRQNLISGIAKAQEIIDCRAAVGPPGRDTGQGHATLPGGRRVADTDQVGGSLRAGLRRPDRLPRVRVAVPAGGTMPPDRMQGQTAAARDQQCSRRQPRRTGRKRMPRPLDLHPNTIEVVPPVLSGPPWMSEAVPMVRPVARTPDQFTRCCRASSSTSAQVAARCEPAAGGRQRPAVAEEEVRMMVEDGRDDLQTWMADRPPHVGDTFNTPDKAPPTQSQSSPTSSA